MERKLIFGIAGFNIAETTRMLEIAKELKDDFTVLFISYGGEYESLVEEQSFPLKRMAPRETSEKIEHIMKLDRMEKLGHPFTNEELRQRVSN